MWGAAFWGRDYTLHLARLDRGRTHIFVDELDSRTTLISSRHATNARFSRSLGRTGIVEPKAFTAAWRPTKRQRWSISSRAHAFFKLFNFAGVCLNYINQGDIFILVEHILSKILHFIKGALSINYIQQYIEQN